MASRWLGTTVVFLVMVDAGCGDSGSGGSGGTSSADGGSGGSAETGGTAGVGGQATAGGGGSGNAGGSGGAAAPDTWTSFAQPFMASYCVECHGAGDALRDYTTLTDVTAEQAEIRCGVAPTTAPGCGPSPAPKQFPIGSGAKPTDDERAQLVAWIDAGLLE